jgi:hypothetical protein
MVGVQARPQSSMNMASNSSLNTTSIDPSNNSTVGWISSSLDRGTIDILWSSWATIFLCVWISTYPNVQSPNDKRYHHFIDKLNLAMIGFLGPDLLFGIAIGQLSNARRSVKVRKYAELFSSRGIFFTERRNPNLLLCFRNSERIHTSAKGDNGL